MFGNLIYNSRTAKTVLIHADHRRRDAASALLIASYLKELGYNTVIGSRVTTKYLYYKYMPELVLLTHPNVVFTAKEISYVSSKSILILMHSESAGVNKGAMLDAMRGGCESIGDSYTKHFSKVLTWGPNLKDWIVDAGLYREDQVAVVGNPRYDFYLNKESNKSNVIGCMPLFVGISSFDNRNRFQMLNEGRGKGGEAYFGEKGGYEDWIWTSAAYVRIYLEFLDKWCLELKNDVNLRPYTLENIDDYSFFLDRYGKHVNIDAKTPFPEWVRGVGVNIFCSTSTIIESAISGTPYITVQEILGDRLEYHQPREEMTDSRSEDVYKFTYRPKSVDELVDLALKASKGELYPCIDLERHGELKDTLWKRYGWPQEKPSSSIVAGIIDELLESKARNGRGSHLSLVVNIERAKFIYRFGRSVLRKQTTTFNDYNFMFWHNMEKSYVKVEFEGLKKYNKNLSS